MNSPLLKKALPHIIAVLVFLIVSVVYCKPALEGKVVHQADVTGYKGMAQQSFEYKEKYGHYPLWTESTFSGMPAYNIAMSPKVNISLGYFTYVLTLGLPKPISFFFLACICFYILCVVLRINPWIGVLGAIAYAWSTYDPVIIVVGHETKMMAIAYAPGIFAGLFLIFQRNYLSGAALLILFSSLQTGTQHLQVVYYTMLSVGLMLLVYLVNNWRQKTLKAGFTGIAIAVVAGAIGIATSAISLLPVEDYSKETMRGGRTELTRKTKDKGDSKDGLDKDYAFMWSYGTGETFTLLVPHIFGGGGDGKIVGDNTRFGEKMSEELNYPEDNSLQMENSFVYWGAQDHGTSGTVYLGAVICFLFLFGLIYVQGWQKWWLLSVALLGIVLAWGKNFSSINYFLFDHFPYYNKFRAPTIALVLPQFAFPLLAALGLQQMLFGGASREMIWKKFKTSLFVIGGILVLLTGYYFSADYKGPNDDRYKEYFANMKMQQLSQGRQAASPDAQQQSMLAGNAIIKSLQDDRQSVFGADLLRTILLIAAAAGLIGLFLKNKIKSPVILLTGLILLSSFDLLAVGTRYLSEDSFVDPADMESAFNPTTADLRINQDPGKGFRVFNTMGDPFQSSTESARTSYFHNSVGGYHPAKLGLYQDLIDSQLSRGNMHVYDMLNAKYFIQEDPNTHQPVARLNPGAYDPCWLVKGIRYVQNGTEEMKALDSANTRDTAIIEEKFQPLVKFAPVPDSSASIRLIDNKNDIVDYSFSAKTNQFAVFSEVYYPRGWNVFLDGKPVDYCRVDYVLRGMSVPAGDHKIEFRFEPHSYEMGSTISVLSSLVGFLVLILAGLAEWRKRGKQA